MVLQLPPETKFCRGCGETKPRSEFYVDNSRHDGLSPRCKVCRRPVAKAWSQSNRDKRSDYNRKYRQRDKKLAIEGYGGKCACCGETEMAFLTIDHVNNDGAQHRKQIGPGWRGSAFYRWLVKNNYPSGFQVLCYNCNCAKHTNGGVCPHEARP